jgi:serine/threonine protein kinase/Flp pilus assembly protein TadD
MIGTTISHYKILQKIGEGGMGVVYKAEDTKLKRTVALKFLPPLFSTDDEVKQRFIHEAQAASALNHTNICSIHTIEEFDQQQFIDMEFVEGKTLGVLLKEKELSLKEVLDIALQIAEGLNAAHKKGIVHRDIKPDNIMVTDESIGKIMDFGLAKLKGSSKLTKTHSTLGTLSYMSPEQARGEEVDQRSDIFSLGAVLYEMITGRRPFKGEHEAAIIYSLLNENPEPLSRYKTGVPEPLQRIIDKALAKGQDERYQHVDEMLVDLKKLIKETELNFSRGMQTKSKHSFRRTTLLWVLVSFVVVALVVGGYLLIKGNREPEKLSQAKTVEIEWTNSIAVLPFRDFSSKKDQEYFCNGMTDAIIGRLAKIQELKVIATTSVMRYRNTDKDIKEIGRELSVANVLEGTLQKEKNKIRLSAQLISTENGFHIWADTYDRELTMVFEIQDDISKAIAEALKVTLTAKARETSKAGQPQNLETYEYHLKGMNLINTYIIYERQEDFVAAIGMFKKAIEIEPNFAASYTGLAWGYQHHIEITGDESEAFLVVKYSEIAYQKNPNSAEANAAMGWVHHVRGDQDKAYQHLRRALELNPNSMAINHVIGLFLTNLGLCHQAINFFQRAIELDPFYLYALSSQAGRLRDIGEFEKADIAYKKVLEIVPNNVTYLGVYAYLLIMMKQYDRAEDLLNRAEQLNQGDSVVTTYQAILLAAKGNKIMAMKVMQKPKPLVYALLSMNEEAIITIKKRIGEGSGYAHNVYSYLSLINNPLYNNLRSDPRFQEIIKSQKQIYEERLKKYGDL